jgi:RNA polymerase sigma-70 factor (ECF subfamily)
VSIEPDGAADRARFEQLYVATRVPVLGYLLRRCGDPADAADLLAETYLTAWRRIRDVPDGDEARLWLYGVARRTLANRHRHAQVENRLAATLRSQLVLELGRDRPAADGAFSEAIADSLGALTAFDREVIELSAYEQLTPAEIAVILGKSPGAIRVRLHRVRRALRGELSQAGYPAPAGIHGRSVNAAT